MENLNIVFVIILIGGWIGGRFFSFIRLPAVLGMMLFGVAAGPFIKVLAPAVFWDLSPVLRSTALIIILLRAGLGLRKEALVTSGVSALLLSFIPCIFEGITLTAVFYYLWGFDFYSAGTAGFLLSAVSPAVVVPSMLSLMENGYGRGNEVPTTVLAGASADDVFAITIFTVFFNLATAGNGSGNNLSSTLPVFIRLIYIPAGLAGAIFLGVLIGFFLSYWFKKHYEKIRATEKFIILLAVSVMFVELGNFLHLAALLGIMTIGFILVEKAENVAHELAGKLGKAWVAAEIILFVLIGTAVDPSHAVSVGLKGAAAVLIGLTARSAGVLVSLSVSRFTWKERLFCVIAYIPKATVQAALGAVPLAAGLPHGSSILSAAVLSILITAPAGLLLIKYLGPRLLDTEFPEAEAG